jgi:hypothetical protein
MGEQHSQKQGLKSSAQKEVRARQGYAEMPASSQDAGAFGRERRKSADKDLSLTMAAKTDQKGSRKRTGKSSK